MKKNSALSRLTGIGSINSLTMKLSFILLMVAIIPINAKTYSQDRISLDLKDVPLIDLIQEIESKTRYNVFYENTQIDVNQHVTVSGTDQPVGSILSLALRNSGINFKVLKDQIILMKKISTESKQIKQQETIQGVIYDSNGVPLLGATIVVKETNVGAVTNLDGEFSIRASEGDILKVTFVGFKEKEVAVGSDNFIEITLQQETGELDEVVLVGYGTNEKRDIIGAVGVVEMENIEAQAPTITVDDALQGQVPGVYVSSANGQPGAPARIRVRGTTSLFGSNQPLYIIDGVPVVPNGNIPVGGTEGGNLGNELNQQGLNTPIGNINTSDIASISILKDASAGAIYGSRAANGVIIIETKKGNFGGEPRFTGEVSVSTQSPRTLDVLNAEQFQQVTTEAIENSTIRNAYAESVLDGSYFGSADTNWEDVLSPSSPITTTLNLNAQGGNQKTSYYTSIGANTQDGVFENTGFDRYSFKLNLDTEISEIWNFGVTSSISYTGQEALDGGVTDRMYIFRPDLPVFDETGHYSVSSGYNLENPAALAQGSNNNQTLLLLTSFFTELELFNGLKAKTQFSLNYNNGIQQSFFPKYTLTGGWSRFSGDGDGYAQESRSQFSNFVWQNTLNYDKVINDVHDISAVLGASWEQSANSFVKAWGTGFTKDELTNITNATVSRDGSSYKSKSGLASYFGRLNYQFDQRYLLTLSGRVDGSSKFAVENKYAFFPAAAIGWRVSEENFMDNVDSVNDLKFRASWGVTGQQDFSAYQWRTLYEADDYGNEPAFVISQLGNDRLKWELSRQFDLGVDFSLFDYRLTGGLGYYVKNTEDAIFPVITPGNTGFGTVLANVGDTSNKGIELQLNADIIRGEDFNWSVGLNASKNSNKLTKISDDFLDEDGFITGFGGGGRLREGSPIGLIYGYVSEGLFQNQTEIDNLNASAPDGVYQDEATAPGDLRFADISGPEGVPDGVVDNFDQKVIGDTQPDFFGGFTNTFSYKGFSLRALFTYSVGNDLHWFNQARSINYSSSFLGENKTTDVLNAWTPENPSNQPRIVYGDPNNNDRISSYYVHDASFLRLKSLNLSYNFSKDLLDKVGFLNSASLYMIGQNLLTITDYPGADPEASNLYNNDISAGRDNNRYPIAKVYTLGLRVGF